MDPVGAFFEEEWDSSNKFFPSEDFELMLHMHGSELFSNQAVNGLMSSELPSNVAAGVHDTVFFTFDHTLDTTNFHYAYQENNNSSTEIDTVSFSNQENVVNFPKEHDILFIKELEIDSVKMGKTKSQPSEIGDSVKEMQFKRKSETPEETLEKKIPNKKSRVYRDASSRNKLRIPQAKRNVNQNQEINGGENGRSCSCYSSEDDFNGGENSESKGSATGKSNGKARGSRGSATDSQSLYARRRRGRINERLRILQNLVPNGTKVDISTMLEEAVHYVKFLQLQIKLLSSDDTWMYAPIAYNGLMDIGIYENNSPAPRS